MDRANETTHGPSALARSGRPRTPEPGRPPPRRAESAGLAAPLEQAAFSLERARRVAAKRFRIPSLHPQQERAIEAVAAGRDVLIIQPTGSGKSLCYQLPALLLDRPTVVVSPLLALIADQEAKLRRLGVPVSRLDSSVPAALRREALSAIAAGGPRVVLTTPETLETAPLCEALSKSGVSLLAVDEAHCISEWGHDFRPAYLRIPSFIERLRPRSAMALTATATPRVREEIIHALRMTAPEIITSPPHRDNLAFSVEPWRGAQKIERLGRLIRRLQRPGIIYCATVESVNRIASALAAAHVPSARYHGRMTTREKAEAQRLFMSPRRRIVMIATSAFGMGIDKPDIRYIVHYHAPGSLEQYVQEAGRAGRDGRPSRCTLLFDPGDLEIQARLNAQGRPKPEALERLIAALIEWSAEGKPTIPTTLALSAQVTTAAAKALLTLLEGRGLVSRDGDEYRLVIPAADLRALGRDLATRFETLRREDDRRLVAVREYAEASDCRSVVLRRYFGEEEPPRCGRCDVCVARGRASK